MCLAKNARVHIICIHNTIHSSEHVSFLRISTKTLHLSIIATGNGTTNSIHQITEGASSPFTGGRQREWGGAIVSDFSSPDPRLPLGLLSLGDFTAFRSSAHLPSPDTAKVREVWKTDLKWESAREGRVVCAGNAGSMGLADAVPTLLLTSQTAFHEYRTIDENDKYGMGSRRAVGMALASW